MSLVGTLRNVAIGGRRVPGIVVSEATESRVEVPSRDPNRKGATVSLPVLRADIITLRDRNPNGPDAGKPPYLTLTNENLRFTFPRYDLIAGLDYDAATGEKFSIEQVVHMTEESMLDFQKQRLAGPAEVEVEAAL